VSRRKIQDLNDDMEMLRRAMLLEEQEHEFYLTAAQDADDERDRETFRALAGFAQRHVDLLRMHAPDIDLTLATTDLPRSTRPQKRSVRTHDRNVIEPSHEPTNVGTSSSEDLLAALDMEDSMHYWYKRAASEASDAGHKALFGSLANDERTHCDLLMMNYGYLHQPEGWQD